MGEVSARRSSASQQRTGPAPAASSPPRPARDRLPPRPPLKPATLQHAKPKEHRFARWMRHRREFLLEELAAYRRVGMALLVGVVFLAACLLLVALRRPRTGGLLLRLFGG